MLRRIPHFEYLKPSSFDEAATIMRKYAGRIFPLAGGTDLFRAMKENGAICDYVLDLKGIQGSDFVREINGNIEIGALATIRAIEKSPLIKDKYPFLSEAAGRVGSIQVRNMATIGGNICNASPSADTVPALIGLKAQTEIWGETGMKLISVEDFFIGPGQSILKKTELVTKIIIPPLHPNSGGVYFKYSPRRTMDIAVVGVGCVLTLDSERRKCIDCRIVLGGVAPTPMRAINAEAVITGREITEKEIEEAGDIGCREARPITDVRGSAEYRTKMVKVFVMRGIRGSLQMIRS